jgi:hypothetical protein
MSSKKTVKALPKKKVVATKKKAVAKKVLSQEDNIKAAKEVLKKIKNAKKEESRVVVTFEKDKAVVEGSNVSPSMFLSASHALLEVALIKLDVITK